MNKALFLDKDGTLVEDVPYNVNPKLLRFMPGAIESLRALQTRGYKLILITNQSGIAKGLFTERAFLDLLDALHHQLRDHGVQLDGRYFCPHDACGIVDKYAVRCTCRKPQAGMLEQACREYTIDAAASWMIGDILHDVEAGNRAGCRTILLNNGHETAWLPGQFREPDYTVTHWQQVLPLVLSNVTT